MLKISRDKIILIFIGLFAFFQALNAGVNSYFGYYPLPELEVIYALIVFFLTLYYLKATHAEGADSFGFGMSFMFFYPILFPYAMIKQKKWLKGIAFIVLWYIVINISYFTWILVDLLVSDTTYE